MLDQMLNDFLKVMFLAAAREKAESQMKDDGPKKIAKIAQIEVHLVAVDNSLGVQIEGGGLSLIRDIFPTLQQAIKEAGTEIETAINLDLEQVEDGGLLMRIFGGKPGGCGRPNCKSCKARTEAKQEAST